MIPRTNERCKLCGKLLTFIPLINYGLYRCENMECLARHAAPINSDTYTALTKLDYITYLKREYENDIFVMTNKFNELEKLENQIGEETGCV